MSIIVTNKPDKLPLTASVNDSKVLSQTKFLAKATSDDGLDLAGEVLYVDIDTISKEIIEKIDVYRSMADIHYYKSSNAAKYIKAFNIEANAKDIKEYIIGEVVDVNKMDHNNNDLVYKIFTILVNNDSISTYNCIALSNEEAIELLENKYNISKQYMSVINEMSMKAMII
jgi:hypothetical protein